jgi:hypothetical protein
MPDEPTSRLDGFFRTAAQFIQKVNGKLVPPTGGHVAPDGESCVETPSASGPRDAAAVAAAADGFGNSGSGEAGGAGGASGSDGGGGVPASTAGAPSCCLVHCQKGMSRSATIVLSYLMLANRGLSLMKALHYVKDRRPVVSPNQGGQVNRL